MSFRNSKFFFETVLAGGAVYIYQNEEYTLPSNYTIKLTGKPESQFGLAMANIGDINKDGCDDIAIGAPYEDNGVVYIYLGSRTGVSPKPSQVIASADLGLITHPIKAFGSSLSGGVDFDGNSYPDLLVGAYQSSAVVALLSRPITNIETEVRGTELKKIDPTKFGCRNNATSGLTCFSFLACCSIKPFQSSRGDTMKLLYTIEAETFNGRKKFSRVFFGADFNGRSNVVRRNIQVRINGQMECQEETVYIKESTRDIQTPVQVSFDAFCGVIDPTKMVEE